MERRLIRRDMDFSRFKDRDYVRRLVEKIHRDYPGGRVNIMEVCGTHTMAIGSYGLRRLMPDGLQLLSGPGCPVCVTPNSIINASIELAQKEGVVITTFGDMMRVPGTEKNLEVCRAEGADVRVLYSPYDMIAMAESERDKEFVFISVGFETTTPGIALTVLEAKKRGLKNVSFICANRLVIPALKVLSQAEDINIDGYLCPGHVSVIIGYGAYQVIVDEYKIPCVVAGFEPVDILMGVYEIVKQVKNGESRVVNTYSRAVTEEGNLEAQKTMEEVFEPVDAEWRGIGIIPKSGLGLRDEYSEYDALKKFNIELKEAPDPPGCKCGEILKGVLLPTECPLFGTKCKPESPVGPGMVSSEGSCAAYYKYGEV